MLVTLKNKIKNVIEEFNRYHGVEITAVLDLVDNHTLSVLFSGSFCFTCGFGDYFEDFLYLLRDKTGFAFNIDSIIECEDGSYKVLYTLK
ncbi:MAG: hypothetical protein ACTSQY_10880 [Candidatus Odinarchaeia archaeon]